MIAASASYTMPVTLVAWYECGPLAEVAIFLT